MTPDWAKSLINGLEWAGPDQGTDWTGRGAIHAPVDLQVTRIDFHSSWPGHHVIAARVLNPDWHYFADEHRIGYGFYVYFAEAVVPRRGLAVNDVIRRRHQVATLDSSYPGCEIGWAQNAHGLPFGTPHDGKPGGPAPIHGLAFEAFIRHQSGAW